MICRWMRYLCHMKRIQFLFIAALLFGTFACDNDPGTFEIVPEVLMSSEVLVTKSRADIAAFIKARSFPVPDSEIKYGVTIYKITYNTTLNGQTVLASGLVTLPDTDEPVGMLSFQHGTIAAHDEAPSETNAAAEIVMFYAAMATPGLIGVVPDLIGFGSSKTILHPYYVEGATADAVMDNLKAARELALTKDLVFNERLMLAGYSQGGYATMATHKAIEAEGLDNFNLIASFPAAGGYDVKGMQEYFFARNTYHEPFYIAYVAMAYKTTFGWTQPLSDMFNDPYATRIPTLFNGTLSGGDINEELTENIGALINVDLRTNIDTDAKYKYVRDAFVENSLLDWTPKAKVFMYHGDVDITVPFENSVHTFEVLNGKAQPGVVTFTALPFANHSSGVLPYVVELMNKVIVLK